MTQLNQIYKCNICGNIVEVVHSGAGELVCCGQAMELMQENSQDAAEEKHVPVVVKIDNGWKVQVGETEHPMEEAHFIEWIELVTNNGQTQRKWLKPGDKPIAEFETRAGVVMVRELCNLHGLWKNNS